MPTPIETLAAAVDTKRAELRALDAQESQIVASGDDLEARLLASQERRELLQSRLGVFERGLEVALEQDAARKRGPQLTEFELSIVTVRAAIAEAKELLLEVDPDAHAAVTQPLARVGVEAYNAALARNRDVFGQLSYLRELLRTKLAEQQRGMLA